MKTSSDVHRKTSLINTSTADSKALSISGIEKAVLNALPSITLKMCRLTFVDASFLLYWFLALSTMMFKVLDTVDSILNIGSKYI